VPTPFVVARLGLRGALVVLGLVAPAMVAVGWRRLRQIDGSVVRRDNEIAVLQQVAMLEPFGRIRNAGGHHRDRSARCALAAALVSRRRRSSCSSQPSGSPTRTTSAGFGVSVPEPVRE